MRRTVDAKEINKVDCIELWALKTMFGLPPLTSTAAVRYVTGTLFTIHRCMDRDETNPVSPYTIEQRRWTLGQRGT